MYKNLGFFTLWGKVCRWDGYCTCAFSSHSFLAMMEQATHTCTRPTLPVSFALTPTTNFHVKRNKRNNEKYYDLKPVWCHIHSKLQGNTRISSIILPHLRYYPFTNTLHKSLNQIRFPMDLCNKTEIPHCSSSSWYRLNSCCSLSHT